MEKSEQTLTPEWLRGSGNVTSGNVTVSNSGSLVDSDDHGSPMHSRNRVSANVNNQDFGRFSFSDRTTSTYFRGGSYSNGSGQARGHNSFGNRNNRYREWDSKGNKEKSTTGIFPRQNYSDPLDNIYPIRADKDTRHSKSFVNGRGYQPSYGNLPSDLSNNFDRNHNNSNNLLAGRSVIGTAHNTQFEKEFPSLGTDERQANPDIRRVSSPGSGTAIQSLPVRISSVIGGDGWTSALVEVPVIVGNNGPSGVPLQSNPTNAVSLASSTAVGLNMAETVAQGTRGNNSLQVPAGNQRLDELAHKQSKLIPLKTTPKSSALNPTEKSKAKTPQLYHASSQVTNSSSVGKLQVLTRERNEVPPTKDSMSPPMVPLPSRTSQNNAGHTDRRTGPTTLEKSTNSHAQSRNDFFNLVRKKSMTIPSPSSSPSAAVAPANNNNEEEFVAGKTAGEDENALGKKIISVENTNVVKEKPTKTTSEKAKGESVEIGNRPFNPNAYRHTEEEEIAFMRTLGWDESNYTEEDEGGLTEEEIREFLDKHLDEYRKLKPEACRRLLEKLGYESKSDSPCSSRGDNLTK